MPEVPLSNPADVRHNFQQVMTLGLPGFVLRQVSDNPSEVHTAVRHALFPAIRLGSLVLNLSFPLGMYEHPDLGLHLDGHGPTPHRSQINIYTMKEGEVDVRLFALQAAFLGSLRDGSQSLGSTTLNGKWYFADNKVDDELLVPVAHTTRLRPADVLIFSDSGNAHDFRSITQIRRAQGSVFYPRRTLPGRSPKSGRG